jgi:hypothetical protein
LGCNWLAFRIGVEPGANVDVRIFELLGRLRSKNSVPTRTVQHGAHGRGQQNDPPHRPE